MSIFVRALLIILALVIGSAGDVAAQGRGELTALAAWVVKSQQKGRIEGRVARALGLNKDGRPIDTVAVTTAYLDGARVVHVIRVPDGAMVLFSQGKANQGFWFLANQSGTLLSAVEWVATSTNPQPMNSAAAKLIFNESKAFWKNQLGRPVR